MEKIIKARTEVTVRFMPGDQGPEFTRAYSEQRMKAREITVTIVRRYGTLTWVVVNVRGVGNRVLQHGGLGVQVEESITPIGHRESFGWAQPFVDEALEVATQFDTTRTAPAVSEVFTDES